MLKHLDLFSGIGGFALAAQMVGGIKTTQFVEIDPYCQKVLTKNFPGVPIHDDITTFTAERGQFDLITFGSPCQDFSCANTHGRGLEGKRSGLFFEAIRLLRTIRPEYAVFENVPNVFNRGFDRILWAFSESGYDAEWQTISAASMGAPHLRERVFIVAYRNSERRDHRGDYWQKRHVHSNQNRTIEATSEKWSELQPELRAMGSTNAVPEWWNRTWTTEPPVLRVDDGVRSKMDRHSPNRMDKYLVIKNAIEQGRLTCDPATGKVFSLTQRGRQGEHVELKGTKINGYVVYKLYFEGHKYMIRGHRIIWWFCYGQIPVDLEIDHINRIRDDNRIENLRLVTHLENLPNRKLLEGKDNPVCKIDPAHHSEILELIEDGATYREVAEIFGISKSQIGNIVKKHSNQLDSHRIGGCGNAVVPQVAAIALQRVLDIDSSWSKTNAS